MRIYLVIGFSIILSILLIGCGTNGNPLELVGKWKYNSSSTVSYTYEFKTDGNYSCEFNNSNTGETSTTTGTHAGGDYFSSEKALTLFQSSGSQDNYFYSISYLGSKTYLNLRKTTNGLPDRYVKQ
jgi:hypothetical protein